MDAGLLLKYTRGQNIFPSSDIDFGIKSEDTKKLVLFSKYIKDQGYLVTTIGNTNVIFEGITIVKKYNQDQYITIDIYIYYDLYNHYCRPNSHKPIKQYYISRNLFRIFNKFNIINNLKYYRDMYIIGIILKYLSCIYSKIYFRVATTSQFAIPKNLLDSLKEVEIFGTIVFIPKNNIEYMCWRYGSKWKIPNKNWRLTDGKMLFLNNLKSYWSFYSSEPVFTNSKLSMNKNKTKTKIKSIFLFNQNEIEIMKKSKIISKSIKDKFE